jgi:hypothetical protein
MSQVEIARSIAIEAHYGQLYGGERDYIEAHVAPIVGMIARIGFGADYQGVGWLHDVLEDSEENGREVTEWDLLERGISEHIVDATVLLTRTPNVPHALYLTKISHNKYATVGKFCDSSVNLANSIQSPDARFNERFTEYLNNITFLRQFLPEPDLPQLNGPDQFKLPK